MRGLDPRIHLLRKSSLQRLMDCRVKLRRLAVRVARSMMIERASSSAKLWATKLYCPPTPLTTWPSSNASETAAPSKVAIMALLTKRAFARARRLPASSP
jgi:hypothetical protein